jgi:hypothetical protein
MRCLVVTSTLLLALAQSGCKEFSFGSKKEERRERSKQGADATTLETFFTISELSKPSSPLRDLGADEVKNSINSDPTYYHQDEAADALGNSDEDCLGQALKNSKFTLVGTRIGYSIDVDFRDCFRKSLEAEKDIKNVVVSHARLRLVGWMECDDVDLSKWNGKTWDQNLKPCEDSKQDVATMTSSHTKLDYSLEASGEKISQVVEAKYAKQHLAGGPCVATWKDGVHTIDRCATIYSRSEENAGGKIEHDWERIVHRSVQVQKDDRYFRGGRFEVEINDWKGSVVNSDANTAPKFTLNKGSETVSGTYRYQVDNDSMSLTHGGSWSKLARKMKQRARNHD